MLRAALLVLSFPYNVTMRLRNWAYDQGWFRQYQPPIPVVVSIGNIVVGGTGKTPVTMMLAKAFYDEASVAILSRGYRSPAEKLPEPVTLCNGKGPVHSAAYCGDEPYLMAENLPKSYVYVGKDRHKSANMAAQAGIDLALLDDGMQHRLINRDYEIVVMDVEDPFGQNHYLPRGFLRESPKSLSRANLIILNHVDNSEKFEAAKKEVEKYSFADVIGTRMELQKYCDLQGNEIPLPKDKKVALFCGIAQPERFRQTVASSGADIIGFELFPDHATYYAEQISQLARNYHARGAAMLICTEKDKVKIPEIPGLALPVVWAKMGLKIVENEKGWESFIGNIRSDLIKRR